jgi:hypothetical protein
MEIVETVPGARFDTAIELPNSTVRPAAKHVSIKSSGNGVKKPRNSPSIPGKLRAELQAADQEITQQNKMVLVLLPSGKRRFVRQAVS